MDAQSRYDAIADELEGRALAHGGAHLFEPMDGRPMKEWVVVPVAHEAEWLSLAETALRLRAG
jgi:hypothetical protein